MAPLHRLTSDVGFYAAEADFFPQCLLKEGELIVELETSEDGVSVRVLSPARGAGWIDFSSKKCLEEVAR